MWLVLWKAFDAVKAYAMTDLESLDMCLSDFAILEVLLHKGPLPINEIARRVSLTSGSMTTAIDRLEKRSLLLREFSPTDRRSRVISLTAQGKKLIKSEFERHASSLELPASSLTKKEREKLITLLKKFGFTAQAMLDERGETTAGGHSNL